MDPVLLHFINNFCWGGARMWASKLITLILIIIIINKEEVEGFVITLSMFTLPLMVMEED